MPSYRHDDRLPDSSADAAQEDLPPTGQQRSPEPPGDRWWRPILWVLVSVSILLVLVSFLYPFVMGVSFGNNWWTRNFLDVNHERNLPTWWNSGLLLLAGLLSAVVGTVRRICRADRKALTTVSWWGLAVVLGLMSLDEFAGFHERLGEVWDRWVGDNPLPAFQSLILGAPLALAVLVFLWLCVRSMPRAAARTYLLGMLVFFLGAIGVEAIPLVFNIWRETLAYHVAYHAEELLEFLGSAVLVIAPLRALYARREIPTEDGVQSVRWDHALR